MHKLLDFHVLVRRLEPASQFNDAVRNDYVTIVADAPVPRWDMPVQRFDMERLAESLCQANVLLKHEQQSGYRMLREEVPVVSTGMREADAIGTILFDALFPNNSSNYRLLGESCGVAASKKMPLRIKLDLAPEIWLLPWELLTPPRRGDFRDRIDEADRWIVRYLGDFRTMIHERPLDRRPTLLVVSADPVGDQFGDIQESLASELDRLTNVLNNQLGGRLNVEHVNGRDTLGQIFDTVQKITREKELVGMHFMGHGGTDAEGGFFWGLDSGRRPQKIYGDGLRHALKGADTIQWAIFNACSSGDGSFGCPLTGLATYLAARKNIPWVIAYLRPVNTKVAERVSSEFYEGVLARREPIEDVIDRLQKRFRFPNEGGLIILERSIEGHPRPDIDLSEQHATPAPSSPMQPATPPSPFPAAPPASENRETRPYRSPAAGLTFCSVPAGVFQKGLQEGQLRALLLRLKDLPIERESLEEALRSEPYELKDLPAFSMGRTPVTNSQFSEFVIATGYTTTAERAGDSQNWRANHQPAKSEHPVINVSLHDAQRFCDWAGYRLPTADEWKKACRGIEGRLYPWGDEFDLSRCNTAESCQSYETTPVTEFPLGASPYGCLDMIGNVEEWTQSTGGRGGKVILGGSWSMSCEVFGLPVLHRFGSPDLYTNDLGFRCAKDGK